MTSKCYRGFVFDSFLLSTKKEDRAAGQKLALLFTTVILDKSFHLVSN